MLPDRDRREEEREQYRELLEELRTIIPGAQVLLAFLLTAPFAARFDAVDDLGRLVFTASLLAVTAATLLFLAPAAYHRIAGHHDRPARLRFGVRTTLGGLALLAVSIACAVFVVVRFVFGSTRLGVACAVSTLALSIIMWLVLPRRHRTSSGRDDILHPGHDG